MLDGTPATVPQRSLPPQSHVQVYISFTYKLYISFTYKQVYMSFTYKQVYISFTYKQVYVSFTYKQGIYVVYL